MGIFNFFSNLIKKKPISLPEKNKGDIVYLIPTKKGSVKLGENIQVEQGYNVVVAYDNNVLDIINEVGLIKLEDVTLPRLFKEQGHTLTKRGIVAPRKLSADLYFVKIDGHNLKFKTHEKFSCKTPNGKMKMRITGNFDFCIKDMRKFMSLFCAEFAFVKNNSLKKELSFVLGDEVSKILNKAGLSFDIYSTCKEKVESLILSKLTKFCATYGIDITKVRIEDLIVSKRQKKLHDLALQRHKDDEFLSEVENSINSAQEEKEKVFVTSSNNKIVLGENSGQCGEPANSCENKPYGNMSDFTSYNNIRANELSNTPVNNDIISNFSSSSRSKGLSTGEFDNFSAESTYRDRTNIMGCDNVPENNFDNVLQKEPILFANDEDNKTIQDYPFNKKNKIERREEDSLYYGNDCKEEVFKQKGESLQDSSSNEESTDKNFCKKCGMRIERDSNFCKNCGTQIGGLVVCSCCGAKNVVGSEVCMVCKSKL